MEDFKHAEILLKFPKIDDYFNEVLDGTKYDSLYFEGQFEEISEMVIEPQAVEEEWEDDEKRASFKEDGYTKEDIIYGCWGEAFSDNKDEIIEKIALTTIEEHFENDMFFLEHMVSYIEKKINETGIFNR